MKVKYKYLASSFADPADLEAFRKCKEEGGTDLECFEVGDNGEGCFGALTAQNDVSMCALHADDLVARWGSVKGSAHRKVRIYHGDREIIAQVEDRCGVPGRIDLNPAAARWLGLTPPFLVPVTWEWYDG